MSLANYEAPTRPVTAHGSKLFDVRGLATSDLTWIISLHREDVIAAATAYSQQKASLFSSRGLEQMTLTLLTKFPTLAAEAISCAADAREHVARAEKLPFSTQAAALHDILLMTFDDAGGLKNLLATLVTLTRQMMPAELVAAVTESLQKSVSSLPTKSA